MKQNLCFFPAILCINLIILFSNCSKSVNPTNNVSSNSYFPNKIGNYWVYDVYDSSTHRNYPTYPKDYEVKISIIGTKMMSDGKEATMWQYEYPWETDTNFVRIVGDTVKSFDKYFSSIEPRAFDFPREMYILPLQNQTGWKGKLLWVDTFSVKNDYNISTGYLNFDTCFNIYHYYYGSQDLRYNDNYWFKPYIGFITFYYQHFLAPKETYLWNLKKYYLN